MSLISGCGSSCVLFPSNSTLSLMSRFHNLEGFQASTLALWAILQYSKAFERLNNSKDEVKFSEKLEKIKTSPTGWSDVLCRKCWRHVMYWYALFEYLKSADFNSRHWDCNTTSRTHIYIARNGCQNYILVRDDCYLEIPSHFSQTPSANSSADCKRIRAYGKQVFSTSVSLHSLHFVAHWSRSSTHLPEWWDNVVIIDIWILV